MSSTSPPRPVGYIEDTDSRAEENGAFDAAVGDAVGVVESEDFVAPFEEGAGEFGELDHGVLVVEVEERSEGLVGFVGVGCEVDAVEMLEHSPCHLEFGSTRKETSQGLDPVIGQLVETGELEVAGPEDDRFEGGSGPDRCDALEATSDFDHSCCEPSRHMKPVEDVGGVSEVALD